MTGARLFEFLGPFGFLILGGCATLRDPRTQTLLINSYPVGATIYHDEVAVARTPDFVDVRRGGSTSLTLRTAGGPQAISLHKFYRWRGSFWPNFIWFIGAPVGWAVDLITGAAYEYEPVDILAVKLNRKDRAQAPNKVLPVAIAPPQSDEPGLSDAGGAAIENEVRAGGTPTLPYMTTRPIFAAAGYDFDGALPETGRARMYRDLHARAVVESVIERRDDHLVVRPSLNSFFDRQLTSRREILLEGTTSLDKAFTVDRWWSRVLPNVVALDFSSSRYELDHSGVTYQLGSPANVGLSERALDYLSAIKLTSLPVRRLDRSFKFAFSLVPTVRASVQTVTATSLPASPDGDTDQRYTRYSLGGGYGPELGMQSGRHYIYINIVPVVAWSRIASEGHEYDGVSLKVGAELGYLYYLGKHWNARFFSRSQQEDGMLWHRALADRISDTSAVTGLVSGVSIGYRFEPSARARALKP